MAFVSTRRKTPGRYPHATLLAEDAPKGGIGHLGASLDGLGRRVHNSFAYDGRLTDRSARMAEVFREPGA